MKKLLKLTFLGITPILFILLIILSINILKNDWQYAHQSHNVYKAPYSWSLYKFKIKINKFFIDFKNNKSVGLKQKHLLISEKSQNQLLSNTPLSTKKWVLGFMLDKNMELREIQVRHKGDNPANWTMEKKFWRIKTKKKQMVDRVRYFEYLPYNLRVYLAGSLAKRMGLLSPNFKLIELFINEDSAGVYIETEKLNENFLRRNRIMPINLYKGEQYNVEAFIASDGNLFNNSGLWSKLATFNKFKDDNRSDLSNFLSLIRKAETDHNSLDTLLERADIEIWSKFAAYQVLAQNYHNDYVHNMRLALDPWSGIIHPIIIDPGISINVDNENINNPKILFDKASHSLFLLLNKSSLFIDSKYKKLFYFTEKSKVITKEITSLSKIKKKIVTSLSRDVEKNIRFENLKPINKVREIDMLSQNFKKVEAIVIDKFKSKPNSSWSYDNKNLSIFVDGELPISDIEIIFKSKAPDWIVIDFNGNNIIDKDELKIFSKGKNKIILPVRLYANRVGFSTKTSHMHLGNRVRELKQVKTKFNILSNEIMDPHSISASNPFTGDRFIIENKASKGVLPTKYNVPIYTNDFLTLRQSIKEFSGIVNIEGNVVINKITKINPGTQFKLAEKSSLIFKNKVIAKGTDEKPITFTKIKENALSWGTIALQGKNTGGSEFNYIVMDGGSGGYINEIFYSSMFSLHNTENIKIKNLVMQNNSEYDDMIHIVYCNNINIDAGVLSKSYADAIDIDISKNIIIKNSFFLEPGNDSIDLMESEALVESSHILNSHDKGISVGESSNVLIHNSYFKKNNIAIAIKDKSKANVLYSNFDNNKTLLSGYAKNLHYGGAGGIANIYRSFIRGDLNKISSHNNSKILIDDSSIVGKNDLDGDNIIFANNVSFDDTKIFSNKEKIFIDHPLFYKLTLKKDKQNRGSNLKIN